MLKFFFVKEVNEPQTLEEALALLKVANLRINDFERQLKEQQLEILNQKNEILNLKERLAYELNHHFGKRAEGYFPDKPLVFNHEDVVQLPDTTENPSEKPIFSEHDKSKVVHVHSYDRNVKNDKKKSCGRYPLDPKLPRKVLRLNPDEKDLVCKCGCSLRKIGEEVTEKLVEPPRQTYVLRIIRERHQCPNCQGYTESDTGKVVTAPVEKTILPKAIATPSLAASIIYRKYAECIPYYKQECAFNYRGIYISRQNMDNWQDKIYQAILPLKAVYQNELRKGKVLHCDETVLQVLNLNEEEIKAELNEDKEGKDYSNRQKCYVWVMMGGTKEHPVLDYNFRWTRSKNNIRPLLEGFEGFMMTDALSSYRTTADEINEEAGFTKIVSCSCNAHCRRIFYDAWKNCGETASEPALTFYQEIYDIERDLRKLYKNGNLTELEFLKLRRRKVLPVFRKMLEWAKKIKTRKGSKFGKAITYFLNQRKRLRKYLLCADMTPDNNLCESIGIRPFTVGRGNWKFNVSKAGAESSCFMFSLVNTAKANGLNPEEYLRNVFEQAPYCKGEDDWEKLLPWNIEMKPFEDRGEWL